MTDASPYLSDWIIYSFYGITLDIWNKKRKQGTFWQELDLSSCRSIDDVAKRYSPSRFPAVKAILANFNLSDCDYLLTVAEDNTYALSGKYISFRQDFGDEYTVIDLANISSIEFTEHFLSMVLSFESLRRYTCRISMCNGNAYSFGTAHALSDISVKKWINNRKSILEDRQLKKQKDDDAKRKQEQDDKIKEQTRVALRECPPPTECPRCGEADWEVSRISPNTMSAEWMCKYCGKIYLSKRGTCRDLDFERKQIPREVKLFVWQRDLGRCISCGSRENLEYDHIIPVSKGGSNTARNIQLLCETCNRSKGSSI